MLEARVGIDWVPRIKFDPVTRMSQLLVQGVGITCGQSQARVGSLCSSRSTNSGCQDADPAIYVVHCQSPAKLVEYLNLDGSARRVRRDVESLDGILQAEAVRDERLDVDQAFRNQTDGLGVLVGPSACTEWNDGLT